VDEVSGDDPDVVSGGDEESDHTDDVEEDVSPSRAPKRTRSTPVEEAKGRAKFNSRTREGFSVDEVAPELEDGEEEVKPKTSSRRRAEPEPEKKSSGKGNFVVCPECGEKVVPSRYNKCPSCAAELDVDVPF
jgi:rubrerythrin